MYKIIDDSKIIGIIFYCYLFQNRLKQSNISGLFYDMVLSDRLVVKYHPIKDKSKVISESRSKFRMPNMTRRSRPHISIPPVSKFSTFYSFCKNVQNSANNYSHDINSAKFCKTIPCNIPLLKFCKILQNNPPAISFF
jgi:hypothetical protein